MNNNLLIIGAGECGQIAYEIAEVMEIFDKIDFLDDKSEFGVGKVSEIEKFAGEYSVGIVAIGNAETRYEITKKLEESCYHIPILVHPRAFVGKYASLRKGCIIEPMAVVHSGTTVGECTIVSACAIINHSVLVDAYCHINVGAIVKAHSAMPMFTKVNDGEIFEGIHLSGEEKSSGNSSDDFIKQHYEKYGKAPNLFDGD